MPPTYTGGRGRGKGSVVIGEELIWREVNSWSAVDPTPIKGGKGEWPAWPHEITANIDLRLIMPFTQNHTSNQKIWYRVDVHTNSTLLSSYLVT